MNWIKQNLFKQYQPPKECIWMRGQTLNRADYPELYALLTGLYSPKHPEQFKVPNSPQYVMVARSNNNTWTVGKTYYQPLYNDTNVQHRANVALSRKHK